MPGRIAQNGWDGIWPDHVPAITAFFAVVGQWRVVAMPNGALIWMGLDYAAAAPALALAGLSITPEVWAEVRLIETAAIEELNRVR